MTSTPDPHKLETLVLARLSSRTRSRLSPGKMQSALGAYLEHAYTPAEQRELIERTVNSLRESGHIEAGALALTDAGRARLRRDLGVDRDLEWNDIKDCALVMAILGLAQTDKARKRVTSPDGLRGCIIKERHGLETREPAPTLTQAVDALVWRALGVETDEALSLNKIRAEVLAQLLGLEHRLSRDRLEQMLAAQAVHSGRTDTSSLRASVIRHWVFLPTVEPVPPAIEQVPPAPADQPAGVPPFDLRLFADAVNRAAREAEDGRFGERRVFISALWRYMRKVPMCAGMGEKEFKARLIEANRHDLVRMHRADLALAMPVEEVTDSQTHNLNAVFHFVEAPPWSSGS
jgi:hypothetical protein